MTVQEAIARADSLRDNRMSMDEKIRLLSTLDGRIKQEVIDTHEGGNNETFKPYDENDMGRDLLVFAPYDDLYVRYLDMHILLGMGEYDKYNAAAVVYDQAMQAFRAHYNATHMPRQVRGRVL